jgi:amino acid transporter
MAEKGAYSVNAGMAPTYDGNDAAHIVRQKGGAMGEAADIYGDIQTAEEYGYVERGLKSRHIQFSK